MPLTHVTPVFSVDAAGWTPLLTDPAGGTATYGTKIDIPGIQSVAFDPDWLFKELFGDNAIIAVASKARKFVPKLGFAKWQFDLFASLMGGTVVDSGTTPNMVATYNITNASAASYGKLEAQVKGVELPGSAGGGDLHLVFWKCKLMNFSTGANAEDFAPVTADLAALARTSDGKMVSLVANETLAAIS